MTKMDKKILIAVDNSNDALKAVAYVAEFLGGIQGFSATVLHIMPEPEEDLIRTSVEEEQWHNDQEIQAGNFLEKYRHMLIKSGFPPNKVSTCCIPNRCHSISESILMEQQKSRFSTLVVGRKELSKSEEFIFGSISSKLVKHARDCAVWVVK